MLNVIILVILVILAAIGLTQAMGGIWQWLWGPKGCKGCVAVIPVKGDIDNIEQVLYHYLYNCGDRQIVILDLGAGAETLAVCQKYSSENINIVITTPEKFKITECI